MMKVILILSLLTIALSNKQTRISQYLSKSADLKSYNYMLDGIIKNWETERSGPHGGNFGPFVTTDLYMNYWTETLTVKGVHIDKISKVAPGFETIEYVRQNQTAKLSGQGGLRFHFKFNYTYEMWKSGSGEGSFILDAKTQNLEARYTEEGTPYLVYDMNNFVYSAIRLDTGSYQGDEEITRMATIAITKELLPIGGSKTESIIENALSEDITAFFQLFNNFESYVVANNYETKTSIVNMTMTEAPRFKDNGVVYVRSGQVPDITITDSPAAFDNFTETEGVQTFVSYSEFNQLFEGFNDPFGIAGFRYSYDSTTMPKTVSFNCDVATVAKFLPSVLRTHSGDEVTTLEANLEHFNFVSSAGPTIYFEVNHSLEIKLISTETIMEAKSAVKGALVWKNNNFEFDIGSFVVNTSTNYVSDFNQVIFNSKLTEVIKAHFTTRRFKLFMEDLSPNINIEFLKEGIIVTEKKEVKKSLRFLA